MRVLAVIHQDDAGPGVFGEALPDGSSLEVWRPAEELGPRLVELDPDAVIVLGSAMNAHEESEYPWLRTEKQWLAGVLGRGVPVLGFQWHSYEAVPPRDAAILARSGLALQAYRVGSNAWGIQFHAEVLERAGAWDRTTLPGGCGLEVVQA